LTRVVLYFLAAMFTDNDGVPTNVLYPVSMPLAECEKVVLERTATAHMTKWAPKDIQYYCVPDRPLVEREV